MRFSLAGSILHLKEVTERWKLSLAITAFVAWYWVSTPAPAHSDLLETYMHPIDRQFYGAKARYHHNVTAQSTSYALARSNYKRRYHREPPCEFNKWFKLATKLGSAIVDDYDDLDSHLSNFRRTLNDQCHQTQWDESRCLESGVIQVCIQDGNPSYCGAKDGDFSRGLQVMMNDLKYHLIDIGTSLPDICFFVNTLEQPRLIFPDPFHTDSTLEDSSCQQLSFNSLDGEQVRDYLELNCQQEREHGGGRGASISRIARKIVHHKLQPPQPCYGNGAFPKHHPMLHSGSMSISHNAVPVLSPAKPSEFGDVLFPSPLRYNQTDHFQDDAKWEDSLLTLFWQGTSREVDHRHILRKLPTSDSFPAEMGFTHIPSDESDEEPDAEELRIKRQHPNAPAPLSALLDLDTEHSSPDLYHAFRSGSVVLRSDPAKEWHDERLIPWLHYIPLSRDMDEVPQILQYLSTPEGDHTANMIAEEGRRWANRALRDEDMLVYLYRLLLELSGRRCL